MAETETNAPEITGRKIFFVNPSYTIKAKIISALQDANYEVYPVENYKNLRALLKLNPNSIVFLNVDNQMTLCGWMALVQTFLKHEVLKDCLYGFISTKIKPNEASEIFDVINLQAGITLIETDVQKTISQITHILEAVNAKGQRQFVRASCINERNASVFLTTNDEQRGTLMHQMKIVDISSASVAVVMPETLKGRLKKGYLLRQATLVLDGRQVVSDLGILTTRSTPKSELVIMIYKGFTSDQEKLIIKEFVFDTLRKKMIASINGCVVDKEDYNMLGNVDPDIINFSNTVKNQRADKVVSGTKDKDVNADSSDAKPSEEDEAKKAAEAYLQDEQDKNNTSEPSDAEPSEEDEAKKAAEAYLQGEQDKKEGNE